MMKNITGTESSKTLNNNNRSVTVKIPLQLIHGEFKWLRINVFVEETWKSKSSGLRRSAAFLLLGNERSIAVISSLRLFCGIYY